ncbi:AAA family ATPase [Ruminobacter sp. RM87]|uniref:AAA family ATPase n=1 Tax=Ruminobacter sp. RM87 TaxID=1200567 RepID=UPI0004E1B666|nr:AAA family ATPase [Ruminobacter sp. RM87]
MSGIFFNPNGNNAFTEIVNNRISKVFVDKTGFIGETIDRLDSDSKLIAFTRPRRFGKTIMARMLASYYSKSVDSMELFSTLKISDYKGQKLIDNKVTDITYKTYLNKFNVIYIDMNTVDTKYLTYLNGEKVKNVADIVDFLEYQIISELKDHVPFGPILEKAKIGNIGLTSALSSIHKSLGITFILIMDEWDLIYREYRENGKLQTKFIDLLRGMFKSSDCLECFSLVYLTGILPIKKYNSQSALNNFKEYNMLRPAPYETYFGFTKDEVEEIVKKPLCKLTHEELKKWYDGYKLNGKDIYNPNSVVSAIVDGVCQPYWSGTSSNEEVIRLINMNFRGIKTDITKLIDGIKIPFNSNNFQNDMVTLKDKNDIFSLLVCLGYLGCIEKKNGLKLAHVPNQEIKQTLLSIVKGQKWSRRTDIVKRSEALLNAIIKKQDGEKVAEIIQDIHNSSAVSLLDYNSEESLTYCVMTALQWSTMDIYDSHREEQAGKGRIDLVYVPEDDESPLIIIEFKYGKSAEEAIEQIKNQEYYKRYKNQYRNIMLVGINYSKSTKEHQCLIERLCN